MIKINNLKLNTKDGSAVLKKRAAEILKTGESSIKSIEILKRSIDARRKDAVKLVYTIGVSVEQEKKILARVHNPNVSQYHPIIYTCPEHGEEKLLQRPVIVGMGPCGLFCAYLLAKEGYRPILIERGGSVDDRRAKVIRFWDTGELDSECNVQFGEGGAGTFSDGKLHTQVKDAFGRIHFVLDTFVKYGASKEIMYDSKPHIGTDVLSEIVKNMRNEILSLGGEVRFHTKLTGICTEDGKIKTILVNDGMEIPVQTLVLAPGHSARDTFRMLYNQGIRMEAKAFAVGLRVQHPQAMINEIQYGVSEFPELGAAPYKAASKSSSGRNVYTFCMCPGGYVVNASSEPGRTAVNGMSYSGRGGKNANSAVIVSVTPEDFHKEMNRDDALCGIAYQELLEERAFSAGKGDLPIQLFGDFEKGTISTCFGEILPEVKGKYCFADLHSVFPEEIRDSFIEGVHHFGYNLKGFDRSDMLLCGVESRTSSPVRILRSEEGISSIQGIYPAGEGAGYAGGITSAAVDGIKTAEKIIARYRAFNES